MKGLMDAATEREKKIAPPLKQYLRRSNADFAGIPKEPTVAKVTLSSKLAAVDRHLSELDRRFAAMAKKLDETDAILNSLFPEEDSEETEEYMD